MNSACGLTKENLLFTFPVSLREDKSVAVLGDMMAQALAQRPEEIGRLSIYPRIDELPEDLLDILAYDFKVDWWDPDWSLEEKRRVFKSSWYVHKHMGTKAAVETAMSAIYPGTKVREWFEYGGEPYCFRLEIPAYGESVISEKQRRALERVEYYKNMRSHLDGIITVTELDNEPIRVRAWLGACISRTELPERGAPYGEEPVRASAGIQGCISILQGPERGPEYLGRSAAARGVLKSSLTITVLPEAEKEEAQ